MKNNHAVKRHSFNTHGGCCLTTQLLSLEKGSRTCLGDDPDRFFLPARYLMLSGGGGQDVFPGEAGAASEDDGVGHFSA